MHILITVLHIVVSIFLVIVVLFQVGQGATIGSTFGGSSGQALFGGAGPATFLSKVTIGAAVIFMATSLYLTYVSSGVKRSSIMGGVPAVREVPGETPAGQAQPAEQGAAQKPQGTAQQETQGK